MHFGLFSGKKERIYSVKFEKSPEYTA